MLREARSWNETGPSLGLEPRTLPSHLWLCLRSPLASLSPSVSSLQEELRKCQAVAPLLIAPVPKVEPCLEPIQHKAKPVESSRNNSFAPWKEMLLYTYKVGKVKEDTVNTQPKKGSRDAARSRVAGGTKEQRWCFISYCMLCAGTY